MVWAETVSQDVDAIAELSERYDMPVLSVHAPCLLISQRVWGANPIPKLDRSVRAAEQLGAQTVVVHPAVPVAAPLRRGVHRTGRRAGGVQRRDGRGGEHVPVPRRPVLRRGRRRRSSGCASAAAGQGPAYRRSRRPTTRWTATTPTTRSTCRTPRPRAPTRSTWPAGWATGLVHLHLCDGSRRLRRRAPGAGPRHPAHRRGLRDAGGERLLRAM